MPLPVILIIATLAQAQDKVVYRDSKLGLQFEYPKTWKARKERTYGLFEIPLKDGKTALVQLYNAKFKGPASEWQLIQSEINRSMKRPVDRQWQEEFLGVPMLMTQVTYTEVGVPTMAQVGLLYTAFEEKMHFRLTAPASSGEEAASAWKDALLSLRTISGDLPATENPDRPSVKPEPAKPTTVWKPESASAKVEKGPVKAELTAGATKFTLSLPRDWTMEGDKLVRRGLAGTMTVTASVGLPEEAGSRLMSEARTAFDAFSVVQVREDPKPAVGRSGAIVGRVFREGTGKSGALVLGHAVGYCEGVYWLVAYECRDLKAYQKDKEVLGELWQFLYAERT